MTKKKRRRNHPLPLLWHPPNHPIGWVGDNLPVFQNRIASNFLRVEILYEDNHLLVVNKPAGLPTMGAGRGGDAVRTSLHQWACRDIARRYNKPGKVFLGVVHRIDQPTTGVVVLARTSKAASRLSAQFAKKTASGANADDGDGIEKIYLAIHRGRLSDHVVWSDQLIKDDAAKRMRVVRDGGQIARTEVSPLGQSDDFTSTRIRLWTGRKHQIRVQSAHHGLPIVGDFKYDDQPPGSRLMLHAASLTLLHPTLKQPMTFRADPPSDMRQLAKRYSLPLDG